MDNLDRRIARQNRLLKGQGYVLSRTPSSVSAYSEGGEFLFKRRTVEAAVQEIKRRQGRPIHFEIVQGDEIVGRFSVADETEERLAIETCQAAYPGSRQVNRERR